MIAKPCITCGEPTAGTRCPEHRLKDTRTDRTHVAWKNGTAWKNLSKRLRRLSPFCEWCGDTEALSVDHILPESDYPELAYASENCRVLCKPCNGRRGNRYTAAEADHVIARLQASYDRRPTSTGRKRIEVAQRAALTREDAPNGSLPRPAGKAQGAMNLTGVNF